MADFNWNGEDEAEDIVLGHQPRTAVFRSRGRGVYVRQQGDMGKEDSLICLAPQGALAVAWRRIEVAHDVGIPKPPPCKTLEAPDTGPVQPLFAEAAE